MKQPLPIFKLNYEGHEILLENFCGGLLGPYRDTLYPLLIFPEGAHSPENLEAWQKPAHRLYLVNHLIGCILCMKP